MNDTPTVCIIEDDVLIGVYLERLCQQAGASVLGRETHCEAGIDLIIATQPTHVLLDIRLGSCCDGVEVAQRILPEVDGLKVIFITGSNEPDTRLRMKSVAPHAILTKPIRATDLRVALNPSHEH